MPHFTHRLPHEGWSKPSRNEEEYFRRETFRSRMELARKKEAERAAAERAAWLRDHGGRCPACGSGLEEHREPEARFQQCPSCMGVWMEQQLFDRLTRPDEPSGHLTSLLRGVILEYTTGDVRRRPPTETA